MFYTMLESAVPALISGVLLMIIGAIGGWLVKAIKDVKSEREELQKLKGSMKKYVGTYDKITATFKNINRATIITICNQALLDNYISDVSFRCLCELQESYHGWYGNSYTDELIEKVKHLYQTQNMFPKTLEVQDTYVDSVKGIDS